MYFWKLLEIRFAPHPHYIQRDYRTPRFARGRRRLPRGVTGPPRAEGSDRPATLPQAGRVHGCRSAEGRSASAGPPAPAGPRPPAPRPAPRPPPLVVPAPPCALHLPVARAPGWPGRPLRGAARRAGGRRRGASAREPRALRRTRTGAQPGPPPLPRGRGARDPVARDALGGGCPGKEQGTRGRGAASPRTLARGRALCSGEAEEGGASLCDPRGPRYLEWRRVSGGVSAGPGVSQGPASGLVRSGRGRSQHGPASGTRRRDARGSRAPSTCRARSLRCLLYLCGASLTARPRHGVSSRLPPRAARRAGATATQQGLGAPRRAARWPCTGRGEGWQGRQRDPQSLPRERPITLSGEPLSPQAESPPTRPQHPVAQG